MRALRGAGAPGGGGSGRPVSRSGVAARTMFCSTVMMGGMMLPSAAPMILTFAAAQARRGRNVAGPTWIFIAAYILVWSYSGLVFMSFSMLARIWCITLVGSRTTTGRG